MKSKLISLIAISGALVGCGGSSGGGSNNTTVDGNDSKEFATNAVTLPTSSSKYGWDLDGDGMADDRLGSIVGVLALAGNPQSAVDTSVAAGTTLFLVKVTSTDSTEQSAKNAGATVSLAVTPTAAPKYDGSDTFMASGTPGQFYGNISGGTFTSNDPAHSTTPVAFSIQLALVPGAAPVEIPLTAGRVTFKVGTDGKVTGGQLNGAIKETDVVGTVIPAVAGLLTGLIASDPTNTTYTAFDLDHNGTVTPAEIEANPTLAAFLKPDVQLFDHPTGDGGVDTYGDYKPTPNGTEKDSLSVGLAFTAVGATF